MIEIMGQAEKAKLLANSSAQEANAARTNPSSSTALPASSSTPPPYVDNRDAENQQTPQDASLCSPELSKSRAKSRLIRSVVLSYTIWLVIWAVFHISITYEDPRFPPESSPPPSYDPSLPHSDVPTSHHGSLSWSKPTLRSRPEQSDPYYVSQTPTYNLDPADLHLVRVLGPQSAGSILYKGVQSTDDHATIQVEARWSERVGLDWGTEELDRVSGGLYLSKQKSKVVEFLLMTKKPHPASSRPDTHSSQLQFQITVLIPYRLKLDSTLLAFEGNVFSTTYEALKYVQLGGLSVRVNVGSMSAEEMAPGKTNITIETGSVYGTYHTSSDLSIQTTSGSVHASIVVPHVSSGSSLSPSDPSSSSLTRQPRLPTHKIHTNTGSIDLKYTSIASGSSPHIHLTSSTGQINLRLPNTFVGSYEAGSNMGSVEVIDETRSGRVSQDGMERTWTGKRVWGTIGRSKRTGKPEGVEEGSVLLSVVTGGVSIAVA